MPKGPVPEPKHIAEEFYLGNTHIVISDDYCKDKTKAEVDQILKEIAEIAADSFRAAGMYLAD